MGSPHRDDLHRLPMMCVPRIGRLHTSAKEVFYSSKNEGSMIDSVNLNSQQGSGHLPSTDQPQEVMRWIYKPYLSRDALDPRLSACVEENIVLEEPTLERS